MVLENAQELDLRVSKDLFDLENHIIAVWEDILVSNPDVMWKEGSIRTIALSSAAVMITNVSRSVAAGGFPPRGTQGNLLTQGNVTLDVVYRAHHVPSADFHRKPRHLVNRRWVEQNMRIIERIERGMVTLVPTSEDVRRLILHGRSSEDMGERRRLLTFGSGLQLLLWSHPKQRVDHHAALRAFESKDGIYQELYDGLVQANNGS